MKKIAINMCYGGFDISLEACDYLQEKTGGVYISEEFRDDPDLIECIEHFGTEKVSGEFSEIGIASIPDNATDWRIEDYDGKETVWAVIDGYMVSFSGEEISID